MSEAIVALTNLPDKEAAERLAHRLVENRIAACVNILPALVSIYRWQGKTEQANEVTLLIKTTQSRYAEVEAAIIECHPYEIPEIIALPIVAGLPSYLRWIEHETAKDIDA